jgi:hypothetical protein
MTEPAAAIASLTAQTELQIEDKRVRWHPMPALQKARRKLHAALARTAHHDHFVRGATIKART